MGSKRAIEIWVLGVPLSRAWLEFAPAELRLEFEKLPGFANAVAEIPQDVSSDGILRHLGGVDKFACRFHGSIADSQA